MIQYLRKTFTLFNLFQISNGSIYFAFGGSNKDAFQHTSYLICSNPAFSFAIDTLNAIRKRPDATEEKIKTWVNGQDKVFAFCNYNPNSPQYLLSEIKEPIQPVMPEALSANEPLYWRQLREYQIAAANFYNENFSESEKLFSVIGANPKHPMHQWGAYLALRSHARAIDLDNHESDALADLYQKQQELSNRAEALKNQRDLVAEVTRQNEAWENTQLQQLTAQANKILMTPELQLVHQATYALLRTSEARLSPKVRFKELSRTLDNVSQDPYQDDHLNDWRLIANGLLDNTENADLITETRNEHAFFDWIQAIKHCGESLQMSTNDNLAQPDNSPDVCKSEYMHAMERWKDGVSGSSFKNKNESRAWLVAALMLAKSIPDELEQAALTVPPTSPEFLTVQLNLVHLYRIAGKFDKARAMADKNIKLMESMNSVPITAQNLFKRERFLVSESVQDATGYLLRKPSIRWDSDTRERSSLAPGLSDARVDNDGVFWLNSQLSTEEIFSIAQDSRLVFPDFRRRFSASSL